MPNLWRQPKAKWPSGSTKSDYGGIDGDQASGAELCCLMSALTGLPMRQDLIMTGAIDQKGNILPIGVIIPRANARELRVVEKAHLYWETTRDKKPTSWDLA